MKIDTAIRHVTKPGANLFLELGFAPDEAKRLQADSGRKIKAARLIKQQLIEELSSGKKTGNRLAYKPQKVRHGSREE